MTADTQRLYNRLNYLMEVLDSAVQAESEGRAHELSDAQPAFAEMLDGSIAHLQRLGYTGSAFNFGDM